METAINEARHGQQPRDGRAAASPQPMRLGRVVTVCPAMQAVLATVERIARAEMTVTLIGETGVGKDVLAHVVHEHSARARGPFVVFDCSAVPPNLVESELFGHERGAFTGAVAAHEGAFERARGGTLFLDEVGELPLDLQPKLLRVLENRCVRPVGGTRDRPADVRVVAATNRDLGALVASRHFREDLYFRLAVAVVDIPPLRERLADLPLLIEVLLRDLGRDDVMVGPAALRALEAHRWPGNVRELKNMLSAGLAFLDGRVLEPRHLRFLQPAASATALERLPLGGYRLEQIERAAILQTLRQTRGNKTHAAQVLGIAVSTLYEKLKAGGLDEGAPRGGRPSAATPGRR